MLVVRREDEVKAFPHAAGFVTALTGEKDFAGANLAIVRLFGPDLPHYHEARTEFYYIAEGLGTLVVGREVISVKPRTAVIVPPRTAHHLIPHSAVKLHVFSVPAWSEHDEHFIDPDHPMHGYSLFREKVELVNELVRRADLELPPGISGERLEEFTALRMKLVSDEGWDTMNVAELRELLVRKENA
ncbi:MAG: cupin domain-containing protein [Candidatus Liptonbacteria bacterium]|nr:cupin domain-containing protein [Candidatus Liptonbacteria bacterium]